MIRTSYSAGMALIAISLCPSCIQGQPSVDDVMTIRVISAVSISPDGAQVAYAVVESDVKHNRNASSVWIAAADGSSNVKLADGEEPAWSPDGKRIAFISAIDGRTQIFVANAAGGAQERLTNHAVPIEKFEWSPDGKKIAFLSTDAAPENKLAPTVVDVTDLRMKRLWVLDPGDKKTRLLTPGDYSTGGYNQWFPDCFSWSPDSRQVVFSKRPNAKAGSHLKADIAGVGIGAAQPEYLVRREGMDVYPRWSPAGDELAFLSTERYDWVKISHLYLLSTKTHEIRNLTPAFDQSVKEFYWGGPQRIYFVTGQHVTTQLFVLEVDTGRLRQVTRGAGVYSQLSLSRNGARCAFVYQDPQSPPEVFVSSMEPFEAKRVSHVNPQAVAWKPAETEIVRWKSFDGMEIEGIVHKPAGYVPGRRYPLLVVPHGGPHGISANVFPTREALLLAGKGWVVFLPNFRGSGNYGEQFLRANLGGWGVGDFQDVMTGVDHLISSGLVDGARMAMSGASYGGYMTAWTISQTNRFKAAIDGCGISDVPSFVRTTDIPERFEDYLGKDPKVYPRHSPMSYGDQIKTPTLIWHGELDPRVPLMQGRTLYTQLRKNGTPVEFVIYPGEGHTYLQPAHERDQLDREVRWLDRWVLGRTAP